MKFDLVVFDLDGTLVDSVEDIAVAVNRALETVGLQPLAAARIRGYVGRGARVLMQKCVGNLDGELLDRAYREFLVHYDRDLLVHTRLFGGVGEGLKRLHQVVKAVISNKQEGMSRKILAGLGVAHHFVSIMGGDSLPSKKPSPDGIHKLLRDYGIGPGRCLMVGDSAVDIDTARAAGVASCGVTYGYRQGDHELDGADWRVGAFGEIVTLVEGR